MWKQITHTIRGPGQVDAIFESGLKIRTDHPPPDARNGHAPEPWSLFLASIGTCVAAFVDSYCRDEGLPAEGICIVQSQEIDRPDGTISEIRFDIKLPPEFPREHIANVIEVADSCTVKRVMEGCPKLTIRADRD